MSLNLNATGFLAPSNKRYIRLEGENGSAVLPLEAFNLSNSRLPADLAAGGLTIFDKKDLEALQCEVRAVTHFADGLIIEHTGWNKARFAQLDGTIIDHGDDPAHVIFQPAPRLIKRKGSLEGWQENVAQPIAKHPAAAFAIMAMFYPAIARFVPGVGNLTLELVGGSDIGKSTIQRLAASVVGPASYIMPLHDVIRDLTSTRLRSRDYPCIIDHTAPVLLTAAKKEKPAIYANVAFGLPAGLGGRLTLISGRSSLYSACEMECEPDAMLTIPIPYDPHGAFAFVPDGYDGCAEFATALLAAANTNHGHAYPEFVRQLCHSSPKVIRSKLKSAQARFIKAAGAQIEHHGNQRAIRAFAAIYAAGNLAKLFHVLPKSVLCRKVALAVLDDYLRNHKAPVPFVSRLERLVESGELYTVQKDADPVASYQAVAEALGTITVKPAERIIKIPPQCILRAFPDWERIKGSKEVRSFLKIDGNNLAAWGILEPGSKRTRLYQFVLPPVVEPSQPEDTLFTVTDVPEG